MTDNPSLTLVRKFRASPQALFDAWTRPEAVTQWFGRHMTETIKAEADLRVGGAYRFEIRFENGDSHVVSGEYREITAPEKLVFTWFWASTPENVSQVTVTITPDGDGAKLTLLHEQFASEEARDMHNTGWTAGLENMAKFLEGTPVGAA